MNNDFDRVHVEQYLMQNCAQLQTKVYNSLGSRGVIKLAIFQLIAQVFTISAGPKYVIVKKQVIVE